MATLKTLFLVMMALLIVRRLAIRLGVWSLSAAKREALCYVSVPLMRPFSTDRSVRLPDPGTGEWVSQKMPIVKRVESSVLSRKHVRVSL